MNNIEIVRELLKQMYQLDDITNIKRLNGACIALLDVAEPKATPSMGAALKQQEKEAKPKKKLDHGKICALYKANWSIKAIADEMDCNQATVRYRLKKEGLIK